MKLSTHLFIILIISINLAKANEQNNQWINNHYDSKDKNKDLTYPHPTDEWKNHQDNGEKLDTKDQKTNEFNHEKQNDNFGQNGNHQYEEEHNRNLLQTSINEHAHYYHENSQDDKNKQETNYQQHSNNQVDVKNQQNFAHQQKEQNNKQKIDKKDQTEPDTIKEQQTDPNQSGEKQEHGFRTLFSADHIGHNENKKTDQIHQDNQDSHQNYHAQQENNRNIDDKPEWNHNGNRNNRTLEQINSHANAANLMDKHDPQSKEQHSFANAKNEESKNPDNNKVADKQQWNNKNSAGQGEMKHEQQDKNHDQSYPEVGVPHNQNKQEIDHDKSKDEVNQQDHVNDHPHTTKAQSQLNEHQQEDSQNQQHPNGRNLVFDKESEHSFKPHFKNTHQVEDKDDQIECKDGVCYRKEQNTKDNTENKQNNNIQINQNDSDAQKKQKNNNYLDKTSSSEDEKDQGTFNSNRLRGSQRILNNFDEIQKNLN